MSRRLRTSEAAFAAAREIDEVAESLEYFLARWHDDFQSHWTGGSTRGPNAAGSGSDAPAERVRAAHRAIEAARAALASASHELAMHGTTLPLDLRGLAP